jgi:hypothetical protein
MRLCDYWLPGLGALLMLGACTNRDLTDPDVPTPTQLTFYQLTDSGDRVDIFWQEWPYGADARLRIETPLEGCDSLAVYVNPDAGNPRRLSPAPTAVAPVRLTSADRALASWQQLPVGRCAVLITAGYLLNEAFMGFSFSTREGVFHRQPLRLRATRPGRVWKTYPLTGITERLAAEFPDDWQGRLVTVSFDWPDGRREEATLNLAEAARLLDGPYYEGTRNHIRQPWRSMRFWVRAAMAELDLDFREQESPQDGRFTFRELVSVANSEGKWVLDPRDGREPTTALAYPILQARYIRIKLE